MAFEQEISGFSIVLVGAFNPTIFSPLWLRTNGLLTEGELEGATINAIIPDISQFRVEKFFEFTVERERLVIINQGPAAVRIYDFILRLFGDVLTHTPLSQAGLNFEAHYRCDSWETFHSVGDKLAPKEPWGDFGKYMLLPHPKKELSKSHRRGGLKSITMEQSVRPDDALGAVRLTVEPSSRIERGIFIRLNDHFQIADPSKPTSAGEMIETLRNRFDDSQRRFDAVVQTIQM